MTSFLRRGASLTLATIALIASSSSDLACTSTSNDCVNVDPSTYDRSCSKDSDCALIDVGQLCSGGCLCGLSAAINVAGLPKYRTATAGISPGLPTCVAGRCDLCPTAQGCVAPSAGDDAGTCDAGAGDAACHSTQDASADGDSAGPVAYGPPWKASSTRLEMTSFGYWVGSSGYRADRASLSGAQLSALAAMRQVPTPTQTAADLVSYHLTIFDQDGTSALYRAAGTGGAGVTTNLLDGDEGTTAASMPTIDFPTFQPFLDTIHCDATRSPAFPADGGVGGSTDGGAAWASAPTLPADPSCVDGISGNGSCEDIWRRVVVAQPATYTFTLRTCSTGMSLDIMAPDGASSLTTSPSFTSPACGSLAQHFDSAGTYLLRVSSGGDAGCTALSADFTLQVTVGP